MAISETDATSLRRKVDRLKEVLENTRAYRDLWKTGLKQQISEHLKLLSEAGGLAYRIEERNDIENLEAIVLTLGSEESGLREPASDGLRRNLIKQNGTLIYQQLFNGKILVLINLPFIEKYGQPQPPKTIAIYRPEELKEAYLLQHLETFISDVTAWEDSDDDAPEPGQRIGFKTSAEQKG